MTRSSDKVICAVALAGSVAVTFISCALFPTVTPEDSGHEAFVRQAVPILHGRKIRGHAEVKLLSDLAVATDRETVLRVLMEQPEFIDHWSETIVDNLKIDREGTTSQASCYGNPRRGSVVDADLANAILSTAPNDPSVPGGAFNMSDVLRSSLARDNLFPIFVSHLYPHVNRPPSTSGELATRDALGAKFNETYLNRQMSCLTCHNSETSTSGAASGWNRTFPIWGLLEKSLYGASSGEPTRNAFAMFRTDAVGGPLVPWGMQDCGTFGTTLVLDPQGVEAHLITWRGQRFGVHQLQDVLKQSYGDLKADGMRRFLPPALQTQCNFCSATCTGGTVDITAAANAGPQAAAVKLLLNNRCSLCHSGAGSLDIPMSSNWANDLINQPSSQKAGETRVVPGMADATRRCAAA